MKANHKQKVAAQRLAEQEARLTRVLEALVRSGVYGGLLMPLVYARIVAYPFVFLKILYLQVLVGVSFAAWIALAIREPKYRLRGAWMFWALVGWFAVMGLSTVAAVNPWRAFFGTQERMTGLFSLLHFLAWSIMVGSLIQTGLSWRRLLEVQLGIGIASAGFTLLQLKYPGLIGSTEVLEGERLSGLFGNPIYAAAYQCFNVYFAIALWQEGSSNRRLWYGISLAAALTSLALAGSRGPLLGLVVGLAVVGAILLLTSGWRKRIMPLAFGLPLLVGAYAVFLVFFAHRPELDAFWGRHGNLKHFFDFEIDLARARLWGAGWAGFLLRPIVGWGLNGFEFAYDAVYRPEYHTLLHADEPHNHVLGVLSETGLIGLVAYLFMWSRFALNMLVIHRKGTLGLLPAACLLGAAVGHFVQNCFAFDTPATYLMTFLVLGLSMGLGARSLPVPEPNPKRDALLTKWVPGRAVAAVFGAVVLLGSILPGLAANYAKRSGTAVGQRNAAEALALLEKGQRTATPYREDQILVATRGFLRLIRLKKLEDWTQRTAAIRLADKIADQHFSAHNNHTRFRRAYASTMVAVGKLQRDPKILNHAGEILRENLERSPKRQLYLFDYARYLVEVEQLEQAEKTFRKAHELNPAIGEPRWELGKFLWTNRGRPEEGAKLMASSAAGVDRFWPTKAFEWQQLAQAYSRSGQLDGFGEVMNAVRGFSKADRAPEVHIAIAGYLENVGLIAQRDEVLRLARERHPAIASIVNPVLKGKSQLRDLRASNEAKAKSTKATVPSDNDHGDAGERSVSLARVP